LELLLGNFKKNIKSV